VEGVVSHAVVERVEKNEKELKDRLDAAVLLKQRAEEELKKREAEIKRLSEQLKKPETPQPSVPKSPRITISEKIIAENWRRAYPVKK